MSKSIVQALGVSFYNGNISDACELAKKGGLITAPSGPGLAQDLTRCPEYRRALEYSDLVLADSGLLCLWKKWVEKMPLSRISGLVFLQGILNTIDWENNDTFWVMPDEEPDRGPIGTGLARPLERACRIHRFISLPNTRKRVGYPIHLCLLRLKRADRI